MQNSPRHSRRPYALGLLAVGMIALSACGASAYSSGSKGAPRPGNQGSGSNSVVSLQRGTKLGAVLADADGRTLYTLTKDGSPVACTGACAAIWPPLTVAAGTAATTAPGINAVGTLVAGGQTLVTVAGGPLYRYSGDARPGDTNGDGIVSFGGQWGAVQSNGASPTTATASGGGAYLGGYGY
jgi:predicted lipoprotein with Yx(FWY)xxD motif